jgi:hypothetical protein
MALALHRAEFFLRDFDIQFGRHPKKTFNQVYVQLLEQLRIDYDPRYENARILCGSGAEFSQWEAAPTIVA